MTDKIIVHEIEPGVFKRWPSGQPIIRTCRIETVVVRRIGQPETAEDRECEAYEVEERIPAGARATFWANFSDEELADRKLFRADPAGKAPDGKVFVGDERFTQIDGVVRQAFDVEDAPPPQPERWQVTSYAITRRVEAAGKSTEADALLDQNPAAKMRFLTVGSVWNDDELAISLISALGLDPTEILAREG